MLKINGKEYDAAGKTLAEFLENSNYDLARIAVERNGDIISKSAYADTVLNDGDIIEIVHFVGGG